VDTVGAAIDAGWLSSWEPGRVSSCTASCGYATRPEVWDEVVRAQRSLGMYTVLEDRGDLAIYVEGSDLDRGPLQGGAQAGSCLHVELLI
jgi:hypothetical protein